MRGKPSANLRKLRRWRMPHTSEIKPARRALAAYERLAHVTSRMREAAALEDWNAVMSLESECATLYADVLKGDSDCIGDLDYQQRKSRSPMQSLSPFSTSAYKV